MKENDYKYLVYQGDYSRYSFINESFQTIIASAEPVAVFNGSNTYSFSRSYFNGSFLQLFHTKLLGPKITVYKLP